MGAAGRPIFTQDFSSDHIDGAPARHMSHGTQELHPISIALVISLGVIPIVRHAPVVPGGHRQLCKSPASAPPPSRALTVSCANLPPRPRLRRSPRAATVSPAHGSVVPGVLHQSCEPPATPSSSPASHRQLCEPLVHALRRPGHPPSVVRAPSLRHGSVARHGRPPSVLQICTLGRVSIARPR